MQHDSWYGSGPSSLLRVLRSSYHVQRVLVCQTVSSILNVCLLILMFSRLLVSVYSSLSLRCFNTAYLFRDVLTVHDQRPSNPLDKQPESSTEPVSSHFSHLNSRRSIPGPRFRGRHRNHGVSLGLVSILSFLSFFLLLPAQISCPPFCRSLRVITRTLLCPTQLF